MENKGHDEVSYYNGFGRSCSKEDAWSMNIVHYNEKGDIEFSCVSACNGHKPEERIKLTEQEELELIRPWAAEQPHHFDFVKQVCEVDGIRVYLLAMKSWKGHKIGMPHYAIVDAGLPRELDWKLDEYLWSTAFSS